MRNARNIFGAIVIVGVLLVIMAMLHYQPPAAQDPTMLRWRI